jgi:hypothetical protein
VLERHGLGGARDARHPDEQVVPEAEQLVVGADGREPPYGQAGPLRELLGHHASYRLLVHEDLVGVHAGHPAARRNSSTSRFA